MNGNVKTYIPNIQWSVSLILVVAIVANWDTARVFIKATTDLSQPGNSSLCNFIVFALFEQKYDV